jgi:hypothetical protein
MGAELYWKLVDSLLTPDEVVEVPSFWTWKVEEFFWRPLEIDDRVRRVIFTLPSVADCYLAQLCCDSQGNPVVGVGERIAQEMEQILAWYPFVDEVIVRGETSCTCGIGTRVVPPEVVDFLATLMASEVVKVTVLEMLENKRLARSVFGFDDGDVSKLRYCRPICREGRMIFTMKEYFEWFKSSRSVDR